MVGYELGAALHVGLVLGFGADAGNSEEILEAFEGNGLGGVDFLEYIGEHGDRFSRMAADVKGRAWEKKVFCARVDLCVCDVSIFIHDIYPKNDA